MPQWSKNQGLIISKWIESYVPEGLKRLEGIADKTEQKSTKYNIFISIR